MKTGTIRVSKFGGGDPCSSGCGGVSEPFSVHCARCQKELRYEKPPQTDHDLEIHTEVLAEQMRGKTVLQKRLDQRGVGTCASCGRPSLPWRRYCSKTCRASAGYKGGATFEMDGIVDSLAGHARRIGINESTVRKRMRRNGLNPIEALKRPVDFKKNSKRKVS